MTDGRMGFAKVPGTIAAALMLVVSATMAANDGSAPYTVECEDGDAGCRVDLDTYIGWRTYNGNCARCHGEGALGSALGPDLTERIAQKEMGYDRFEEIVREGVKGEMGVMPGWEANGNVMSRLDHLWGYLQARTDGVLPVGRPQKLAEKDDKDSDTPSNWE